MSSIDQAIGHKSHEDFNLTSSWSAFGVAFALGTGMLQVLALAVLGCLFDWRNAKAMALRIMSIGRWESIYLIVLLIFLGLYVSQSRPELIPPASALSQFYFIKIMGASLLIAVLPMLLRGRLALLYFLGFFCLGVFFRGVVSVLLSFYYLSPPFYGNVFDINKWGSGNSPGVANMLALSVIFCAGLLANYRALAVRPWVIGLLVLAMSTAAGLGVILQARLFFIVVFVLCPILYVVASFFDGSERPWGRITVAALTSAIIFYVLNRYEFMQRGIDMQLAADLRFGLFRSFFSQIGDNFWAYAKVDPVIGYAQFHNFFMDAQRVSGPGSFLMSIVLGSFILFLSMILAGSRELTGKILWFLVVPCLLIMCFSVEPEGGGQIYLMLLAAGSVGACILDHDKRKIRGT